MPGFANRGRAGRPRQRPGPPPSLRVPAAPTAGVHLREPVATVAAHRRGTARRLRCTSRGFAHVDAGARWTEPAARRIRTGRRERVSVARRCTVGGSRAPAGLAAVRRAVPRDRDQRRAGRPGQAREIRLALVALIAEGHLLIEDVPGVGKTMLAKAIARSIDCSFRRIQFTPDLLPTDVTGVNVFNQEQRRLRVQARARSSPTSCWATRSTGPARRRSRRCSSAWRSARSRWTPRPTRWARRSW